MVPRRVPRLAAPAVACLLLAACQKPDAASPAAARTGASRPAAASERAELKDVLDTSATHVIGISYPAGLAKYPQLAALAQRFAAQARDQLIEAERQRPPDSAAGPYELSMEFQLRHDSPQLVVLAVDGSTFTGGAHSMPIIQRWVWLPAQNRQLTAAELFPQEQSWTRISSDVRAQLKAELQQRLEADDIAPNERAQLMKSATAMIEGGTEPKAEDFAVFEPLFDDAGHVSAVRFVFPPYQVGPYSDGTHTVELPAAQLVQDVAPQYRALFATAG
ncbi:DUF3298 and DUF4163 domain-containing protein [Cognatilysobacter terrigena]|uniref:DUF3298 and DUF4163 domain-containing protein n=1 Tax=Cognatilysobacter terrigena TaxID=2488749 RepID=UPI001414E21B|nr:DUF3298 and DUF4163 domain-containing protein [Lysobacter terrigena]